jgi:Kef-type K+ transport system membrane component KefB
MIYSEGEVARLLISLAVLLAAAHAVGYLFARLRQPRVIGEILAGLLLGPTVLGAVSSEAESWIFPTTGPTAAVLGAIYQLGLLLLMFSAGTEIRTTFDRGERRTVAVVTLSGTVIPLLAGLLAFRLFDPDALLGPEGSSAGLALVFAIAIAVTSIPVISRIMFDLGILETAFARIVLTVAVLEDVLLYVLLAIALSLVQQPQAEAFALPDLLGLEPASTLDIAYHVGATLGVFALFLLLGPPVLRWSIRLRASFLKEASPIGAQILILFVVTGACIFLGIAPIFGAFLAGIVVGSAPGERAARARERIKDFSFAFFIPIYFAIVGLRLDLIRHFDPLFFLVFLAFACIVKFGSVYLGARLARETPSASGNIAVALNARGGPGIVLASVAFDAGLIAEGFYTVLVLLAVITSLMAGSWLHRVVASDKPLRERPPGKRASEVGGA